MKTRKTNKKAWIFSAMMSIILLVALVRVYILVRTGSSDLRGEFEVGSNQLSVFNAIQESEKSSIYGEEGFSIALQQAIYEVSRSGGYLSGTRCGKSRDFFVWQKGNSIKCYPDVSAVKENIAKLTLIKLNSYLRRNPYTEEINIDDNHEVFLEQKEGSLIARAYSMAPLMRKIICDYGRPVMLDFEWVIVPYVLEWRERFYNPLSPSVTGQCGWYSYKSDFTKKINFDINNFNLAAEDAENIFLEIEECRANGVALSTCVDNTLRRYAAVTLNSISSNKVELSYNTGRSVMAYNENTQEFGLQYVWIKFALDFA